MSQAKIGNNSLALKACFSIKHLMSCKYVYQICLKLQDKRRLDVDSLLAEKFISFSTPLLDSLNKSVTILEQCIKNGKTVCVNPEFHGKNMSTNSTSNSLEDLGKMLYAERKRMDRAQELLDYWTQFNETYNRNILEDTAMIHVYFKQLGIINYIRDELYSGIDFLGKLKIFFPLQKLLVKK